MNIPAMAGALLTVWLLPGIALAGNIHFTQRPSFVSSPDPSALAIIARNVASDCDTTSSACGSGYFNQPGVQLWAFPAPVTVPLARPGEIPDGGWPLAATTFTGYDPASGTSNARSTFVAYKPPPQSGTYYLAMLIIGSSGPLSAVIVYDVWSFPDPVVLGSTPPTSATVSVVEYHDAALGHYFMTPLPQEIALCDAGEAPCTGWVPTGGTFEAYPAGGEPADSVAACRFYNDSYAHTSSHFYASVGGVCEDTLRLFPDWHLETANLFATHLPTADGSCSDGFVPVFRLYNNGMGGAPNHRFTTDAAVRSQMLDAGWIPEGAGQEGVAFCVPP
jgi:hypothetical protein